MEDREDPELNRLLGQLKSPQAPLGFERRVMARLREEREQSVWPKLRRWGATQTLGPRIGFTTACAALVFTVGVSVLFQWKEKQKTERLVAALDAFEQYQQDQEKWPELDLYTWQ